MIKGKQICYKLNFNIVRFYFSFYHQSLLIEVV